MTSKALAAAPFFSQNSEGVFVGNDPARGPWSADHCHAGPVTGLAVRAAEIEVGADKMLCRLTLDILRPLPLAGLRVAAETTRHSRTLATTQITVHDLDNNLCALGTSMHLVRKDLGPVPTAPVLPLNRAEAVPGRFSIGAGLHALVPVDAGATEVSAEASRGDARCMPQTLRIRCWETADISGAPLQTSSSVSGLCHPKQAVGRAESTLLACAGPAHERMALPLAPSRGEDARCSACQAARRETRSTDQ